MRAQWWAARARPADPGRLSPGMATLIRRVVGPIVRLLHRPTLAGTEHLPAAPYLLVANHSGGMGAIPSTHAGPRSPCSASPARLLLAPVLGDGDDPGAPSAEVRPEPGTARLPP